MSEVLRRGVIVIDLIGGKVEIPAPNIGPVLKARQEELKLVDQLTVATLKALEAQDKLTKAAADDAAARAFQQQAQSQDKAAQSSQQLSAAYQNIGSGVFRLARATVLLGADSDESFQKMIRGLAYVQAGFDLFKGTTQIVKGLAAAETAMAAATAAETVATVANTGAHAANAAAKTTSTAASLASAGAAKVVAAATNPVTLAIVGLTAVIMTGVEAWDYFTESAKEAAEAQERYAAMTEKIASSIQKEVELSREVAAMRREGMDPAAQADAMGASGAMARGGGEANVAIAKALGASNPATEKQFREGARGDFQNSLNDLKAERDLRKQILDSEISSRDETIRKIEQQEKLVQSAQKQLDLEKEKVKAFQAQIGSLTKLEQDRLVDIRDKLKAGKSLSRFEEKQLAEDGGDQGRGIVDAIRAKRGEAAGFDKDFFKGIEGAATGVDDAAKALKEVAEALKAITGNATPAAKIAELEKEKAALNTQYQEFLKGFKEAITTLTALVAENNKRLAELEAAAAANAG